MFELFCLKFKFVIEKAIRTEKKFQDALTHNYLKSLVLKIYFCFSFPCFNNVFYFTAHAKAFFSKKLLHLELL